MVNIKDARNKKWDAVIIYDPDRLARRYSYQELVMDELREAGVEVIFITVSSPKNSEDKILHGVRGLFAEYERAKIAERFRLGKLRTVKEGHVIANAPYGYKYILKNKENGILHGYYEIVEDEARVMRMIFGWVANEGETIRGVIKRLKVLEIKPRKSKKGVWSTSTLSSLLDNKVFIGEAHYGKHYSIVPEKPHKEEKYRKNNQSYAKTCLPVILFHSVLTIPLALAGHSCSLPRLKYTYKVSLMEQQILLQILIGFSV